MEITSLGYTNKDHQWFQEYWNIKWEKNSKKNSNNYPTIFIEGLSKNQIEKRWNLK